VLKWVNGIDRWGVISKLYAVLSQLSAEELLAAREVITKRAQDVETSLVIKRPRRTSLHVRTAGLALYVELRIGLARVVMLFFGK
jgi:hypothetical protein